ncbi:cytochrome P450 [Mycena rebaudengoi]|nr:cytochrome P450 [Mycena rebaudengoi]
MTSCAAHSGEAGRICFASASYNIMWWLFLEKKADKYFSARKNSMREGYRILGGPAPGPEDINITTVEESGTPFVRHVLNLFRKERILDVMPQLLNDVNGRMDDWGKDGRMNPFVEMHNLIFQMTVRMGTCRELAVSPLSLMMPWFPGRAKRNKKKVTRELFDLLTHYVDLRRKSRVPSTDSIDMLIAQGYDDATTIAYTLGIIFAGVLNTSMNGWPKKSSLLFNHGNSSPSDPLHCRFSTIALSAWEEEMPVLDAVIKETMRLALSGTALRRNMGGDTLIAHKTVRDRESFGDVHFDEHIYANPFLFDPGRFLETGDEETHVSFPFLGWGAGRHPCAGMRAAKLEIKIAIALFLSKFEYQVVDASGHFPESLPQPDRNDIQQPKPLGDPYYFRFKRVEGT